MHSDPRRTGDRLTRFVDESLRASLHTRTAPLALASWEVPDEPVPFGVAQRQRFEPFAVGSPWGRPWSTLWLRVQGTVPGDWAIDERHSAEVSIDLGFDGLAPGFQAEGLAFRPDGTIVKGVSPRNSHLPVDSGGVVDLFLELAANPGIPPESHWRTTPLGDKATAGSEPLYRLRRLELALVDREVWNLLQDIGVARGLAEQLSAEDPRSAQLWTALDRMLDVVDPDSVGATVTAARAALAPALAAPAAASAHTVVATGHAHIDSAWLWPVRETVRKCARTFSNVVALMDEHPDFRFSCSSAQQLAWVKESYPELFARIREKVATGQFVLVGGQWVEPDTNLPGGESTVRQLVHGKRFFLEEFGVETTEVWLPDTFGYTASLPQIIRLSGSDWFMTQKISWNQSNAMPHHTFWWEGIDGTRVFTHFPPIDTYNAELSPAELAHAQRTYRDHGAGSVSLAPFGWGDGGGGPTREMVASAHRQADLDGSPRVRLGTPREFFEAARAERDELPVWSGEMYLELHRGTLTSQLRTKQGNRRLERLLREAELWSTTASVTLGRPYPYDELERIWRRTLLLQFHDILPGSSIAWVHREAEADHARLAGELEEIVRAALGALAGEGEQRLVANSASVALEGVAAGAIASWSSPSSSPASPGVTIRPWPGESGGPGGWILENGRMRVAVDADGLVRSVCDASGREAVAPGERVALLRLHRDVPDKWDAWDLDRHYRTSAVDLDTAEEVSASVRDGVAVVEATRRVGATTIVQTISLGPGRDAVDITLDVDWHERHKLLKLVIPLDVHADRSTSEIQFGHLDRPTHTNTSWDEARFEFVAHRWIRLGEEGYAIAIANDSTFGHSVTRDTRADGGTTTSVGLSVLRAPTFPDPESDQGRHTLRFALRPGASLADAAEEGHRLDRALREVAGGREIAPLVRSSDPAVRIETVKPAEDRSGDLIVRLFESSGGRRSTVVETDAAVQRVQVVDLLERPLDAQPLDGGLNRVNLQLRPFQIITLRYGLS
ncbi:glycosyl hydrolase-related protein [Herbiconiux moechotypicola]|uniref:Glycoside hydrolase family 38 C-terminal domain-containing protein n=1 Tax=Herbiconiux moechotypicola TaxID=637393 RepID=A0ABP5Q9N5_9MICO|nr:glycoside hydrolase family 38 C-terminal domain-containing protein [Herbiconiux moechotypicola]MCS5729388.1 glycosyl hydrolase-related protein [Herbiconiux moechotypicola]